MSADALLEGLDDEQRRAATTFGGPLAIVAGAGSGKTRTVSTRIAYGSLTGEIDPDRCLALTFTGRAAGQLRSRLQSLGAPPVAARTIHSAALRQLRYFWPMLDGTRPPHLLPDAAQLLRDAAESLGMRLQPRQARDLLTDIGWAKAHFIDEERFAAHYAVRRPDAGNPQAVARVYAEYEQLKSKTFAMDFDDVLLHLLAIFEEHPDAVAQVRRQYRHITVDEFQDLTPLQFWVVKEWVGPRGDICAVGDPAQSIYGFAGATSSYLRRFQHEFGRATVVHLSTNYRCAQSIIAAAARFGDVDKPVSRSAPDADPGSVVESEHEDHISEVHAVADRIVALLTAGDPPMEVAVLVRQQEQARAAAEELRAAGVPTVERAATGFFERPEVRQALHRLRTTALLQPDADPVDAVLEIAAGLGWTQQQSDAADAVAWDSLAILVEVARRCREQDPENSISDVLEELQRRAELFDVPSAPAVSVLTMHAAKGLEWDHVFVLDVTGRHLPSASSRSGASATALMEEARLLYVAATRARKTLSISWSRASGGRSPLLAQPLAPA